VVSSGGPVIGVLGGSGGIGASSFAAVLALVGNVGFLIDLDVSGGGIDITLGIEHEAGARWSGIQLSGGALDPETLADGLPRVGPCAVLAADTPELDGAAVEQVLEVAAESGPVVVDLPRHPCPERAAALPHVSFVVLVARGDVAGLVAAHTTVRGLPEIPLGLVLRRGPIAAGAAATLIGAPLLGELPAVRNGPAPIDASRLPRAQAKLASGLLLGLGVPVGAAP
jgi:hypothetical protein